jgi:hypothetical protein
VKRENILSDQTHGQHGERGSLRGRFSEDGEQVAALRWVKRTSRPPQTLDGGRAVAKKKAAKKVAKKAAPKKAAKKAKK